MPDETARPHTDLKELRAEIRGLEEKAEVPSHDELKQAFEGGSTNTRLNLVRSAIRGALPDLHLGDAELLPKTATSMPGGGEKGEPEVYVTQIQDRWTGKNTDSVLVRINLQNGDNPNENTIAIACVKQKGGVLDLEGPGTFWMMSEHDYNRNLTERRNDPLSKFLRADSTSFDYAKDFQGFLGLGESIHTFQTKRDSAIENNYAYWQSENALRKGDLLNRLERKYAQTLEDSRAAEKTIKKEIDEREKGPEGRADRMAKLEAAAKEANASIKNMETFKSNSERLHKIGALTPEAAEKLRVTMEIDRAVANSILEAVQASGPEAAEVTAQKARREAEAKAAAVAKEREAEMAREAAQERKAFEERMRAEMRELSESFAVALARVQRRSDEMLKKAEDARRREEDRADEMQQRVEELDERIESWSAPGAAGGTTRSPKTVIIEHSREYMPAKAVSASASSTQAAETVAESEPVSVEVAPPPLTPRAGEAFSTQPA